MENQNQKKINELFSKLKTELNLTEVKNEEAAEKADDNKKNIHPLLELEKIVLEYVGEVANLEEKRLMAVAESHDTARRFQTESQQIKKYGGEKLASEMIGPIDTFRKVLQSSPDNPEIKNYLIGFEMIVNQIDQALKNAGIKMIATKIGDDFSPILHNAIEEVNTDAVAPGKICAIISNGYQLHDRVIKHAVVKVAKA